MGETKREPIVSKDDNGDEVYSFDTNHTFADIARWIIKDGGREEVLMFLEYPDML